MQKKIKLTETERAQKRQNFEKKAELLQKVCDVEEVIIKWECEWKSDKETKEDVKYFMKHIYNNPPLQRLNPREAGILKSKNEFLVLFKWYFLNLFCFSKRRIDRSLQTLLELSIKS